MRSRKHASDKSGAQPEQPVWVDIAFGLAAGLVATQITNLAQRPLSWVTPDHVDRHEKKVRPGASSSLVASQKISETLNLSPSKGEQEVLGQAIHFATGISWGPVYGLLRRYGRLKPVNAALVTGGSMSLILDEALVPALGLSAPNNHYPAFTRIRGLAAHLVFGAAVAVVAEGLAHIVERRTR